MKIEITPKERTMLLIMLENKIDQLKRREGDSSGTQKLIYEEKLKDHENLNDRLHILVQ